MLNASMLFKLHLKWGWFKVVEPVCLYCEGLGTDVVSALLLAEHTGRSDLVAAAVGGRTAGLPFYLSVSPRISIGVSLLVATSNSSIL